MELDQIFKIWDRFEKSSVSEMELETGGIHLKLKEREEVSKSEKRDETAFIEDSTEKETKSEEDKDVLVQAPLVGTFYRASAPDAEPFVKIGQKVEKGEVVGIIETMKLMNEILSPVDGIVEDIPAEDGSMVEYDQVLIKIKQEKE